MMFSFGTWDYVLLALAGYVAIVTLVRLMRWRRDELLAKLRSDFSAEKARLAEAERLAGRQSKRAKDRAA